MGKDVFVVKVPLGPDRPYILMSEKVPFFQVCPVTGMVLKVPFLQSVTFSETLGVARGGACHSTSSVALTNVVCRPVSQRYAL